MATQQYNVLPGAYHAHSVCVCVWEDRGEGSLLYRFTGHMNCIDKFTDILSRILFSYRYKLSLSFTNEMLLFATHPDWYAPSSTLFFDTSAFLLGRKRNLQPNNAQSDKRRGTSGKAVFLFNRIIAKRIIVHCLLNTQAEIMT